MKETLLVNSPALAALAVVVAYLVGSIPYLARAEVLGCPPDAILIDAYVAGQPGGTGATVCGDVLVSMPPLPRLILAGGLTPANVAAKVELFRPWMVDVASGVESAPGRKDFELIAAFVRAAKTARVADRVPPELGSESERIAPST